MCVLRYLVPSMCLALLTGTVASADNRPELESSKARYLPRQTVVLRLDNDTGKHIEFRSPWRIRDRHGGRVVSRYFWTDEEKQMDPGARRVWRWEQDPNEYSTEATTDVGGHVGPGSYVVEVDVADYTLRSPFEIGRYFTIGFDGRDDTFIVYVIKDKAIDKMKAEAEAQDKTLIVSGIVRGKARYNRPWSYTMGPGSIVLGEVFTEVCDANPDYVEEHRRQWKGDRWCPWSSYVQKVGR